MSLTWTAPGALWLLLTIPLVWVALRWARTSFNVRQRWLQASVQSLILASLVLAFARPVLSTSSSRESVVYLVDVSHSVASRAIQDAARAIDDLTIAVHPAHWRIVVFGSTAAPVRDTEAVRRLADVGSGQADAELVDRRGTDIEAALDAARAELAPGHVPRLVLFSDGRQTAGDAAAAALRLSAARIPIFTAPMTARSIGDAWVDALEVPERIPAGATIGLTVVVRSQRTGAAAIELSSDGQPLGRRDLQLAAGEMRVTVDCVLERPGAHVLRAALVATGDPLPENNVLEREVWAEPHANVLYVEGTPASAHYLAGALKTSGFDVTVQPPSAFPATRAELEPYDAVILSDVKKSAIPDSSIAGLADWVERGGGGLLVAGGESVFGEGGYRKSPLERLTPVTFERRDEPEVALILVLDRSWSMAGTSMELCKKAAQAAIDVLTDEQAVGVLTFNDGFAWDVTLRNVGKNRDDIRKKVAAIEPGGHTLIYPAVEQAYLALRSAKARAKHVILLSDGRSYPAEYERLVERMVEAHMTVSSVAVGAFADNELLGNIAKWGKGRTYLAPDAKQLPEIFVKEAKNAMTPSFDEESITPIVKAPSFLSGVDTARLPRLKGRTATVIKDTALEVMTTDDDDPLLAFWPIGLGRSAVFASDVKDRWGSDWVKWKGYGPFFASVLRAIERHRPPAAGLDVRPGPVRAGSRTVDIAVEARTENGAYLDLLKPVVQVRTGARPPIDVRLRQVSPGRYQAAVVADATEPLTVRLADETGSRDVMSRSVLPETSAEYRFRPPDEALLQSVAKATGGLLHPTASALADIGDDRRADRRPIWPFLVFAALGLWLLDILLRRVRVFEPRVPD